MDSVTNLVAIGHRMQQGKDALAEMLTHANPGTGNVNQIQRYSDPLKEFVILAYGVPRDLVEGSNYDKGWITEVPCSQFEETRELGGNLTIRELLQQVGMSLRSALPGVFAAAPLRAAINNPFSVIIAPDLRFKDEARLACEAGATLIRVIRPGCEVSSGHVSEHDLDDWEEWHITVLNDGTMADLADAATRIQRALESDDIFDGEEWRISAAGGEAADVHKLWPDSDLWFPADDPASLEAPCYV